MRATWPAVEVFDGPPVTGSAPDAYVTVGYVLEEGSAGDFNQERGDVDGLVEETGAVRCELVAATGDVDLPAVMDRVATLLDQLDAAVRADQSLGGVLGACSAVTVAADFAPVQNTSGASVRVAMSVQYSARPA